MDTFVLIRQHGSVCNLLLACTTVNVEIFAQYIFSRITRRALDARKFDVSENFIIMLDARKLSCAKICTFTVSHFLIRAELVRILVIFIFYGWLATLTDTSSLILSLDVDSPFNQRCICLIALTIA